MDALKLYRQHRDQLTDFWSRRHCVPRYMHDFRVFGRRIRLTSNEEHVLAAAGHCRPLYSTAPPTTDDTLFSIHVVVQAGPDDTEPVPANLFDHTRYAGHGDWLMMQLGQWGHAHVDLSAGRALAVLAPSLARRPETVCQCLLNTIITNLFIAGGYGMLHASCLFRAGRALLLLAPHNTGKSTTALRLALAGYPLLSDSMVFVPSSGAHLQLLGFPVGKIKLRQDVVQQFPRLEPLLTSEPVRDEVKYSVDLREVDLGLVHETVAEPAAIELCLLEQSGESQTRLVPASRAEALDAVMANSLYYDTEAVWQQNLAAIQPLIERARFHCLAIGSDGDALVATVSRLWDQHE